jgi:hypothetical protein
VSRAAPAHPFEGRSPVIEPQAVADLFSSESTRGGALEYLRQQELLETLNQCAARNRDSFPPAYPDLARLHRAIRTKRVFTVPEFGLGYSTIVMADALSKNSRDWDGLAKKPKMRNSTPFQLRVFRKSCG